MDLGLYMHVIRRHRMLVIVGVGLTVVLALLSYIRISPSGIGYRSAEVWSSDTRLTLSQPGSPEFSSVFRKGDARRPLWALAGLTDVYAAYVTSDEVVGELKSRLLLDAGDLRNGLPIAATALPSTVTKTTPLIEITVTASSSSGATALARGTTEAFVAMVERRQSAARIPEDERVNILVVRRPGVPKLVAPRSKTPVFLVLVAGLTTTLAALVARGRSHTRLTSVEAR